MVVAATPAAAQIPPTRDNLGVSPPWQEGRNNDAPARGFQFTVPDADNLADFHGSPLDPALALYVGGNYFFAMAPLVAAFEAKYPEYKGKLYWETVPPGMLVTQIKAGGTVTVGNMTWTRSEEHTSELQSLMRISYAVFCLKINKNKIINTHTCIIHINT